MAGRTKELVAYLTEAVELELKKFGDWSLNRKDFSFVRKHHKGFWLIQPYYKSWAGKFLATSFIVAIRLNDVQNLINLDAANLTNRRKNELTTLGTLMINICGDMQWNWDIEDKASAEDCAKGLGDFLTKTRMSFFERYSDPHTVLECLLSGRDKTIQPIGANYGILVAALSYLCQPNLIDKNVTRVLQRDIPEERDRQKVREFVALLNSLGPKSTIH